MRAVALLATASAMALGVGATTAQGPLATLQPEGAVVATLVADTDGDGRVELLLVGGDGVVLRHGLDAKGALVRRGGATLRDPTHTLLAVADIHPEPGVELVVCDTSGTSWVRWPAEDVVAPADGQPLVRRARNQIRVDRPRVSSFVQDLNSDGRMDVLLPTLQGVQPYLQEAPAADGTVQFRSMALLPVRAQARVGERGAGSDPELQGEVVVPQVQTSDLNGDGRPDLLTRERSRRAFHLQAEDGTFREPVEVDIDQFEDSTPKATVAPGETVVLGDRQLLQRGDIDGDGIPDFVVAHRRKVWTFLSSKEGPQFQKARTQAVADDVSAMLVLDLDDDAKADLLAFQVQLPGVASLILGLVQSIDIDIRAVGYRSENGAFAGTPAWRRTVTLRIPPILSLLGKQQELVQKFTDIVSKARLGVRGGFLGTGRKDLALLGTDGKSLELYATDGNGPTLDSSSGRKLLRRLLFEDPNPLFDLDRIFSLVSGILDDQAGGLVGDRKPVATVPLRDAKEWRVADLLVGSFDGAPRDGLMVVYELADPGMRPAAALPVRAFDLVAWPSVGK
ncbi:MAG: hypothetical protein RL148_2536 [Planctomycetota bacterium]